MSEAFDIRSEMDAMRVRLGAVEHREIMLTSRVMQLSTDFADLRAVVYSFANTARSAHDSTNEKLDVILSELLGK